MFNLLKSLFSATGAGRYSVKQETEVKIRRDWDNIELLLKQGAPSQLKQALVMADKAVDNALRDIVAGETMGERLKNAEKRFDRVVYNKIWEAHKVRNNLVHESGYEPPHFVLKEAVENLRKGLNSLGVRI